MSGKRTILARSRLEVSSIFMDFPESSSSPNAFAATEKSNAWPLLSGSERRNQLSNRISRGTEDPLRCVEEE